MSGDKSAEQGASPPRSKYAAIQVFMIPTEVTMAPDATTHEVKGGTKIRAHHARAGVDVAGQDEEAGVDPAKFLPPPMSPPQKTHRQRISLLPAKLLTETASPRHQNPARRSINALRSACRRNPP